MSLPQDELSFAEKLNFLLDLKAPDTNIYQIAQQLDMATSTLFRLVAGERDIKMDTALYLCQHFGIGIEYFHLRTAEECKTYLATANPKDSYILDELSTALEALTQEKLDNVLAMLTWMESNDTEQPAFLEAS